MKVEIKQGGPLLPKPDFSGYTMGVDPAPGVEIEQHMTISESDGVLQVEFDDDPQRIRGTFSNINVGELSGITPEQADEFLREWVNATQIIRDIHTVISSELSNEDRESMEEIRRLTEEG